MENTLSEFGTGGSASGSRHIRSAGVTFFSWLFIVLAAFGLSAALGLSGLTRLCPSASPVCPIGKGNMGFIYFFSLLMPALSLIAGIFILRLKDWARKLAVILRVAIFVLFFVNWLPAFGKIQSGDFKATLDTAAKRNIETRKEEIKKMYKPEFQEKMLQKEQENLDKVAKVLPIFLYAGLFWMIAWNGLIIFFFTRPKVREQFIE